MPTRLIAVLLLALGLTACSSSGSHDEKTTSPSPLAAVVDALGALTSVHLDIDAGSLGGRSATDVALDHGKSTALRINTNQNGTDVQVLTIGTQSWVKLPTPLEAGRPWTVLSGQSSDPTVKALANPLGVVRVTGLLADLDSVGDLLAATSGTPTSTSSGATTTWTLTIDPGKLPAGSDLRELLTLAGNDAIPAQLDVDAQHRPTRIALTVKALGVTAPVTIALSAFDAPLQLSAPDPAQISSK